MCKNEYRKMEIRKPAEFESVSGLLASEQVEAGTRIDRKAFMNSLGTELEKLDEGQRTVFVLRFEENLSIKEIAYELGYDDIQTFSRFFKSKEGMSPMQYREQFDQASQNGKTPIRGTKPETASWR